MTIKANAILRQKKSDTIVLIAPNFNTEKGWFVDACHNYKTGRENIELRQRLEACNTFDELVEELDGHATNVPNIKRSNDYMR